MKSTIVAAAVAASLGAPAVAQGATLTAEGSCFASTVGIPAVGTGFTPGASVTVEGDGIFSRSLTADGSGNIATTLTISGTYGSTPKTVTITASEASNPGNTATLAVPVVKDAFVVDANLNGNPRSTVRWRFAGFRTGEPIYGHFRFGGKTYRNYRFGTAQGACGTLSVRARRLPVSKLRYGTWKLKFDQVKSYTTKVPGRTGDLRIFRTFG